MTEPVDWDLAARVAGRIGGKEPLADSYHYAALGPDFHELTARAEELVGDYTGLRSSSGPARAAVTDRAGWVQANIQSFQRLLRPVTERLADRLNQQKLSTLTRRIGGFEVGAVLGWMSTRVLGQYDLLIIEDDRPEDQDMVYYVGPNILALEKRYSFPPEQFRLWIALHEVTHRAQFTGIPWLRAHFLSLVNETLDAVDPDPKRFVAAAQALVDARRPGEDPLRDGGLPALLASPAERETLDRVTGLMSLLEGHGDVTMDRAGAGDIPSADRFSRVLRQRRNSATGVARLLQRLIGIEAKINQYQAGERFIAAVEKVGGPELVDRAWIGPENLPTMAEIRDPDVWIARVR